MKEMTIKEVLELVKDIDTARPKENNYFTWHAWRMRMVKRAILLLAARIAARGFELFVGDTYVVVNVNGMKGYIQYNELEWTYSNAWSDILLRNDNMVVVDSWDFVEKAIRQYARMSGKSFEKETKWMRTSDSHIHIKKTKK